tara:strand:- start:4707 stop:4895 length:189 start_codon:yes stop_codon:yes gene_type:complete
LPRLDLVTVADSRYEVLARLPKSKVDDVEREKSLYFGADTILQSGDVLLVCRKVIDVEYEEL